MDSQEFARQNQERKRKLIAASFSGEAPISHNLQKGSVEDSLTYTLNQRAIHSDIIRNKFTDDKVSEISKAVELDEDTFEKAVSEQGLIVFTKESLDKFKSDLVKGFEHGKLGADDIEKAKKDLSKLTKVKVSGKDGKEHSVWVKRGEEAPKEKKAYQSETKTKEEGSHIISRAKAALDNPKTPMSMRAKAQEMIDHETEKWAKEHAAAADYSHPDHKHHNEYKSGVSAKAGTSHAFDKTNDEGKAKAAAWEAGHKSVDKKPKPEVKPEHDAELEKMYDKNVKAKKPAKKEDKIEGGTPAKRIRAKNNTESTKTSEKKSKGVSKLMVERVNAIKDHISKVMNGKVTVSHTDSGGHIYKIDGKPVAGSHYESPEIRWKSGRPPGGKDSILDVKGELQIHSKHALEEVKEDEPKKEQSKAPGYAGLSAKEKAIKGIKLPKEDTKGDKPKMTPDKAKEIVSKYNKDGSDKKPEIKKKVLKDNIDGVNVRDLATQAIRDEPEMEVDEFSSTGEETCTGACAIISDHIQKNLKKKGIESKSLDVTNDKLKGAVGDDHSSLFLPKQNLILDTQVWQFTNNKEAKPDKDIKERKILYTPEEYKALGFKFSETN